MQWCDVASPSYKGCFSPMDLWCHMQCFCTLFVNCAAAFVCTGTNGVLHCLLYHFSFTNNFGVLGILDHLHGTDVDFRKHISSKRHFTLKSFASAKEVVPDTKED